MAATLPFVDDSCLSQNNTKHNEDDIYQIHICLHLAVEAKEGKASGELRDALVPPSPNPRHSEKNLLDLDPDLCQSYILLDNKT